MDFKVETYIDRKMEFIHVDPFKKMCKESDRNETTHDLLLETRSPPLTKGHDHSNGSGSFELDGRNSFKFHLESSKPGFVAESENPDRTDENTRRPGETLTADDVDDSFIDHKMEFIFVGPRPKINAESRQNPRSVILRDTMPCDIEPATMKGHPGNDSKPVHQREQDGTDGRRNIKSDLINKESMRIQTSFELPVGASPFTTVINPVKLPEDDSGARNGQDIDFGSNGPGCGLGEYGRASSGSMSMGKCMTPDIGDKACRVSVLKGTSGQDLDKNPVVSDRTSVSITDIGTYPSEDNRDETCIESVAKGTLGAVLTASPSGNESTSFDTTSIRKSLRAEIGDETFIDRKMEVIPFEPFQKINKESMRIQTSFELPVGGSPFTTVINPVKLPEDDSGARNGQDIDFGSNGPACGHCDYGRASSGSMSMGKSMTPDIGDKACRVSVLKGTSGQDLDKNLVASDRTSVCLTGTGTYPSEDHGNETCIGSVAKGTLGAVPTAPPSGNESTSFDTTSIRKSLRAEIRDETFIDRKMEVILFEPFQKINKESMRIQTSFQLPVGGSAFTTVINPVKLPQDDSGARKGQGIDCGSNGPGCGPGGYGSTTSGSMSMGKSMTPDIGDKACRVSVLKGTSGQDLDKNPVLSDRTGVSITGIAMFPSEVHEDETCIESVAKGTLGAVPAAAPRGNESTSFNTTSIRKSLRAEIGDETFIDRKMEVILFEPFKKINKGSMRLQTSFELPVGGSPVTAVINPVQLPEDDSSARNGQDIDFKHKVPVGGSYSQDHDRTGLGRSLTAEIGDETCIDRKMEVIHVDNFEKVKVRSSTICYDS